MFIRFSTEQTKGSQIEPSYRGTVTYLRWSYIVALYIIGGICRISQERREKKCKII